MTLLELQPTFLARTDDQHFHGIEAVDKADGIIFLCPVCFRKNEGPIGTHSVICWRPHVPQTTSPKPGRWGFQGTDLSDLTLVAGSSSILLEGGCSAHFFVRNGQIEFT